MGRGRGRVFVCMVEGVTRPQTFHIVFNMHPRPDLCGTSFSRFHLAYMACGIDVVLPADKDGLPSTSSYC